MPSLEEIYPPFGLSIACGPLELRVLRDDDFPELVELVQGGISDPDLPMPFITAWHEIRHELGASDAFPATSLAWWWTQRAQFQPDHWQLALAVRENGVLVGMQDALTHHFPLTRSVSTGSWLGRPHQGHGLGTLMRQMVVGFAFDHLGAVECLSGYVVGNRASEAVSRKVGYRLNGVQQVVQDGAYGTQEVKVRVTPDTFVRPAAAIRVTGAEPLCRFLDIEPRD